MAKTIKFNLICDGNPIRTIEDLQNNFSIEDILAYYENKLLHRWLDVRGYHKELEKINSITTKNQIEISKELINIFDVISDHKKIEESVYILEYMEERKLLYNAYNRQKYKTKNVIDDYHHKYQQLVNGIIETPNDIAKIKGHIAEILNNYKNLFELNHRELFWILKDKSFLAIMCLLMNEQSRKYYLPIEETKVDGITVFDTTYNQDKLSMYTSICFLITTADFKTSLGSNLISFAGVTEHYWKDLEPKDKKYMIISMGSGDFVRSTGVSGGDLSSADVTNKFVITDGIDYKSNSNTRQLLYMEV